jgi:hypothetical protein
VELREPWERCLEDRFGAAQQPTSDTTSKVTTTRVVQQQLQYTPNLGLVPCFFFLLLSNVHPAVGLEVKHSVQRRAGAHYTYILISLFLSSVF